jgi:hypothetical protein
MFIEVENMGIKGGPIKVLIAADAIEEINLGNTETTSFIMLRGGRQIHIAQDYEGIVAQLRGLKLLDSSKADQNKADREKAAYDAQRSVAAKHGGAVFG